jgi:glutamyl-tRNA reductase
VPATRLAVLLLHQRSASLDARERLTAIASAASPGRDLVPLLTCHRVELYAAIDPEADPRLAFVERLGTADPVLGEAAVLTDGEAAEHAFRVAAGLDSAIVGEGQIAGQMRRAHETARSGGLDPILASLFQRALHLARTVRATTPLGTVRRSIGSLAVDEALRHVADPTRTTALVIGAGEIGKLAARALASRIGRLVIANRDATRAAELAGPIDAEALGLDRIADGLERADVVISAADTRGMLLTRDLLAARAARRPLVVVDIAVPRSVAEDARALDGLVYHDVDHLAAAEASAVPAEVVDDAARRCEAEAASFTKWLSERDSADTIRELRDRANEIRERQLARAMRRLGHLSDRDREVVESLATGLTHALLHEPTVRLRGRPEAERAARRLFGLDPPEATGADDTADARS